MCALVAVQISTGSLAFGKVGRSEFGSGQAARQPLSETDSLVEGKEISACPEAP